MDLEHNKSSPFIGYAGLAEFIGGDKDHSTQLYKAYAELAARDLSYRQSELAALYQQLQRLDAEDVRQSDVLTHKSASAARLWPIPADLLSDPSIQRRKSLILEIRKTLQEYR